MAVMSSSRIRILEVAFVGQLVKCPMSTGGILNAQVVTGSCVRDSRPTGVTEVGINVRTKVVNIILLQAA